MGATPRDTRIRTLLQNGLHQPQHLLGRDGSQGEFNLDFGGGSGVSVEYWSNNFLEYGLILAQKNVEGQISVLLHQLVLVVFQKVIGDGRLVVPHRLIKRRAFGKVGHAAVIRLPLALDEFPHHGEASRGTGMVQRRGAHPIARVPVGAVLQKEPRQGHAALGGGGVQGGAIRQAGSAGVDIRVGQAEGALDGVHAARGHDGMVDGERFLLALLLFLTPPFLFLTPFADRISIAKQSRSRRCGRWVVLHDGGEIVGVLQLPYKSYF